MRTRAAFEGAVREHSGRILAALVGQFRDLQLAEESLQDAWLAAAERWPVDGWPERPAGWVYTVAHRRALDHIRRERSRRNRQEGADRLIRDRELDDLDRQIERWNSGIDDDRLRLIFTCCHPVLDLDARVALTLRTVTWVRTEEIATAFGVPLATMQQRLVRARQKIKRDGVPYRVPDGHELPDRLAGVLRVVYLVFNEAYLSVKPDQPIRVDLADEAIRLGRLLVELMPDEPETMGLLALMLAQHARSPARFDDNGDLVLLEHQDRSRWLTESIGEASQLAESALRRPAIGPYQLQAAIAALHSESPTWESTDWPQIVSLYGVLAEIDPSPVIALNRAVAIGFADGAGAGLRALEDLGPRPIPQPHLFHATRAEFLARVGRADEARTEFEHALELVGSEAERRHIDRRRAAL